MKSRDTYLIYLHKPRGPPANSIKLRWFRRVRKLFILLLKKWKPLLRGSTKKSGTPHNPLTYCSTADTGIQISLCRLAKRYNIAARQNVSHRSGFSDTWDYWFSYHWSTWFNRGGITVSDAHTETLITPGQDVIIQFNSIQFSLFTN